MNQPASNPICWLVIGPNTLRNGKHILEGTCVFLSQYGGVPRSGDFCVFRNSEQITYEPFCDDFGPMNALCIFNFIELLDAKIRSGPKGVVYCADDGPRAMTNAVFLLGAYMILKLKMKSSEVSLCFRGMDPALIEHYRDASHSKSTFDLELADCWQALERGHGQGWIACPTPDEPSLWGMIDKDAYAHYDEPLNADLHEIVPKKLIVFRGPKNLGGREFCDNFKRGAFAFRDFSPEYSLDILKGLGVSTVVRLNEPQYDEAIFASNGIRHVDLISDEDVSTPPPQLVSRFFKTVDEAGGCVALHGQASFGRAGTLVALYLMRMHDFSAREAIGWVRIMRPGSIIGSQQHYICSIERATRELMETSVASARLGGAGGSFVDPRTSRYALQRRSSLPAHRQDSENPGRPAEEGGSPTSAHASGESRDGGDGGGGRGGVALAALAAAPRGAAALLSLQQSRNSVGGEADGVALGRARLRAGSFSMTR